MKFRGHLIGGMVAGAVVVGIAVKSGAVSLAFSSPLAFIQSSLNDRDSALAAAGLFLLTLVMSLFPDLDTASVPQRWFFRAAFVLLLILLLLKQMDMFAIVTFLLLLPLLHRHRGWTHSKWTPFVLSIFAILVLTYIQETRMISGRLSIDLIVTLFQEYWTIIMACVLGHYTHLVLDSR